MVADLHLGYNEARRRGGESVPLARVADVLAPLARVVSGYGARRLLVAGDLFEAGATDRLVDDLLTALDSLGLQLVGLVPGNHDRRVEEHAGRLPLCPEGVVLGGWRVLHGDGQLPAGPVVHGHVHPCLRWGNGHSAPCYLVGPERLVLPALSRDAAGVSVQSDPRWRSHRCCVPAGEAILDFGEVAAARTPRRQRGRRGRA